MYSVEISRANPTCFVFLLDQSASMQDRMGGGAAQRKCDVVADALNRLRRRSLDYQSPAALYAAATVQ